ncbi:MAG TPA: hypothetical protein VKT49_10985 [Bryobacteraceae bacterium]|nr:hypothetical protein [Bryobacteraceae bacterium]
MTSLREPRFETRRRAELYKELVDRARAWLPEWRPLAQGSDSAGALLAIAARLESEVAQRLDKMPEKMYRGFLDWLGVRGKAAQAARVPLVFSLTANSEPVLAAAPVQVQATPPPSSSAASSEPVTFETEDDVMLVPGSLASLCAVDPSQDAFYLPPAGFSSLDGPKPGPDSWTVQSTAKANSLQIQLQPALGLDALPTLLHQPTNLLYRVTKAEGGLVTVDPPVGTPEIVPGQPPAAAQDLQAGQILTLQSSFDPFGAARRNLQQHALYIGSESLLNLPADAQIEISGISDTDITWSYWGKSGNDPALGWQPLGSANAPVLNKDRGSVEMLPIGGKSSRWLRGTINPPSAGVRTAPHISLRVNSTGCNPDNAMPCPPDTKSNVAVEGIANTTPLVLDSPFYPLGREPRLFDAFYLGCPEAFSKSNASVQICFEAQDGTAASFSAAQSGGGSGAVMLFGIGSDGYLHRMRQETNPLKPPVTQLQAVRPPINDAGAATVNATPVLLTQTQGRLSTYTRGSDLLVAAMAEKDLWIWSENPTPGQSGKWYSLGTPIAGSDSKMAPAVLLLRDGTNIHVIVLSHGALSETTLAPGWETAATPTWTDVPGPAGATWAGVAPIFTDQVPLTAAPFGNGWIAVEKNGRPSLYVPNPGGAASVLLKKLPVILPDCRPLAVRSAPSAPPDEVLFVAPTAAGQLDAWTFDYTAGGAAASRVNVSAGVVGYSFDWWDSPDGIAVVFTTTAASGDHELAAWFPQASGALADSSVLYLSQARSDLVGSPALTPQNAIAPGASASILVWPFNPSGLTPTAIPDTKLATALVVDDAPDYPKKFDFVDAKFSGGHRRAFALAHDAALNGVNRWVRVEHSARARVVSAVGVYRNTSGNQFAGRADSPTTITLLHTDPNNPQVGDALAVTLGTRVSIHTVQSPRTAADTITVAPNIQGVAAPTSITYEYVQAVTLQNPQLLPLLAAPFPSLAAGAYFGGAQPAPNPLLFLDPPAPAVAAAAILKDSWTQRPAVAAHNFTLITNAIFGALVVLAANKTANPALSWEYFDGQAWWTIPGLNDTTSNLLSTGIVSFCVPNNLQQGDVAGRKSYWIRARLVGGDYGQETVTVSTKPDPNNPGGTIQTVNRSLDSVSPPVLASVNLTYSVCCSSDPDYILTFDGGEMRDQTAANTAAAAQVEFFMPLAESIRRASSSTTPDPGAGDPALYLGFDAPISGGPLRVLFLAQDQDFGDAAFPLQVDVLRETGFEALVPEDGTRGLGESGVLTFSLSKSPPAAELFGVGALRWIRLRPKAGFAGANWAPNILGAYLNAVYARASQTQELEHLGSSNGAPRQTVFLARPPVLQGSLELRVLEPLGDEDVQALRQDDPNSVLDQLSTGQAGPWVLWQQIDVIEAAGKGDRCYSLDSDSGEIVFGDGVHGSIPPIGTDSIVAIRYKRGGGAAANSIAAWSAINLTAAVQGVQRVVNPDGAAGGSDPQTPEEVIRYAPANQFMRDRALTLRDFEKLAVQSSRDIVQARALPSGAGIQLVAVVRGQNPLPSQAQWRALLAELARCTSPALAAPAAIVKLPPRLVQVQVALTLAIQSIDSSGSVGRETTRRLLALVDPATGGLDRLGWPLGTLPTETDISAALDGVPSLESIESVTLAATFGGAAVQTPRPEDLPVITAEDITIQFQTVDVEVGA